MFHVRFKPDVPLTAIARTAPTLVTLCAVTACAVRLASVMVPVLAATHVASCWKLPFT